MIAIGKIESFPPTTKVTDTRPAQAEQKKAGDKRAQK